MSCRTTQHCQEIIKNVAASKPTKHPSKEDINTKLGRLNNIIGNLNKLDEEKARQDQIERSKEFEHDLKMRLSEEMICKKADRSIEEKVKKAKEASFT